jgi:hypothetical protein
MANSNTHSVSQEGVVGRVRFMAASIIARARLSMKINERPTASPAFLVDEEVRPGAPGKPNIVANPF